MVYNVKMINWSNDIEQSFKRYFSSKHAELTDQYQQLIAIAETLNIPDLNTHWKINPDYHQHEGQACKILCEQLTKLYQRIILQPLVINSKINIISDKMIKLEKKFLSSVNEDVFKSAVLYKTSTPKILQQKLMNSFKDNAQENAFITLNEKILSALSEQALELSKHETVHLLSDMKNELDKLSVTVPDSELFHSFNTTSYPIQEVINDQNLTDQQQLQLVKQLASTVNFQGHDNLKAWNYHESVLTPCALSVAIKANKYQILEYLLSIGENVNGYSGGKTPIFRAVEKDAIPLVDLLLANDSDISKKSKLNGKSVIHYASSLQMVKRLLKENTSLDEKGNDDETLLFKLCRDQPKFHDIDSPYVSEHIKLFKFVANNTKSINTVNKDGETALKSCIKNYRSRSGYCTRIMVELLCKAGAEINVVSKPTNHYQQIPHYTIPTKSLIMTLLDRADSKNETHLYNIAKCLIRTGIKQSNQDWITQTTLGRAIEKEQFQLAKYLIKKKIITNVMQPGINNMTKYFSSEITSNQLDLLQFCFEQGATPLTTESLQQVRTLNQKHLLTEKSLEKIHRGYLTYITSCCLTVFCASPWKKLTLYIIPQILQYLLIDHASAVEVQRYIKRGQTLYTGKKENITDCLKEYSFCKQYNEAMLIEHRHQSAEHQQAYDQRFALTIINNGPSN